MSDQDKFFALLLAAIASGSSADEAYARATRILELLKV